MKSGIPDLELGLADATEFDQINLDLYRVLDHQSPGQCDPDQCRARKGRRG
ncbi:hypothetical protein [Palleronia abyssalis]|uniref:hypothetical protein n=1 Tax=Palleronia abyssalis TaxID=1501240 RepID=UPI0015E8012C|nr:hypothetical protein [Palleronia abyssalis]